jgi:hypothetical protein
MLTRFGRSLAVGWGIAGLLCASTGSAQGTDAVLHDAAPSEHRVVVAPEPRATKPKVRPKRARARSLNVESYHPRVGAGGESRSPTRKRVA